jgi:hypothetical protein
MGPPFGFSAPPRISNGTLTPLNTPRTPFRNVRHKQVLPYQQAASLIAHQNPTTGASFQPM